MKRFGLGSKKDKSDEAVDDPSRNRLFGSRSSKAKASSQAPTPGNPYAVPQQPGNPYAVVKDSAVPDPYAQPSKSSSPAPSGYRSNSPAKNGYASLSRPDDIRSISSSGSQPQLPAYDAGGFGNQNNGGYRNEKSPASQNGYAADSSSRYNNTGDFGNQRGYGSDPWGGAGEMPSRGPSGYGGMGRSTSQDTMETEAGREALFGGAKERLQQRQPQSGLPPEEDPNRGYGGGYGAWEGANQGYGRSEDRQLTAEEMEEEDVQGIKNQIREIKQKDIASLNNALRSAAQAEATGLETLARLNIQGDMLHETDKNLDLAANQNAKALENAKELKRLNRSMFAPNVGNPFTKARRQQAADDAVFEQHVREREQRGATRAAAYTSMMRHDKTQKDMRDAAGPSVPAKKSNLAERSKFQFEADSDDDEMENQIDSNLDSLERAVGGLNRVGQAIGAELVNQIRIIEDVGEKTVKVDDGLAKNTRHLANISRKG